MKKTKIIIPALGILLLSTAASVTGTVAWFSANTTTTVTGMKVKTKVSSNLLIAADTLSSAAKKEDSEFLSDLEQDVKGYLEPVSSVDGSNFFYTLKAKANGAKESGDYIQYNAATAATDTANYGNKFSQDYGVTKSEAVAYKGTGKDTADAYVDYDFQLKAVATANSFINLKKLYLIDGNPKDDSKAHRIAVFTQDITSTNPTSNALGALQAIFTEAGAANQTNGKAVNSATTLDVVSYNSYADNVNNTLIAITPAGTKYYKVVVRMWLEGEDTTCYNDKFQPLTNEWSLDLEFEINTVTTTAANGISKILTGLLESTRYYYDGTNVYTTLDNAKAKASPIASPSAEVKALFGIN